MELKHAVLVAFRKVAQDINMYHDVRTDLDEGIEALEEALPLFENGEREMLEQHLVAWRMILNEGGDVSEATMWELDKAHELMHDTWGANPNCTHPSHGTPEDEARPGSYL